MYCVFFFLSFNRKPRENTVFLVFPSVSDWAQTDHCRSEWAEHKTFHFSDNFLLLNNGLLYELRGRLLTHFHQGGRNKNGQRSDAVQLIQTVLVYLSHAFAFVVQSLNTLQQIKVVSLTWKVQATPLMIGRRRPADICFPERTWHRMLLNVRVL